MKQRSRKSLSYKEQTVTQLSVESEIKGKLKITYDGKDVEEVYLAVVEISNSGNVPIVKADYEEPIELSFGKGAQILTTEIAKLEPENLQISISFDGKTITLAPSLINPKESVTIKSLVNKLENIYLTGRIVGIKEIGKSIPIFYSRRFMVSLFIGVLAIGGAGTAVSYTVLKNSLMENVFSLVFGLGSGMLTGFLSSWLYHKMSRESG
jgi:hypothetical protein